MLHDANDAFYDVIDKGEVAFAVAVVEDLDGLAFTEFVGEAEVGHVWTTCRTIDCEESETGRGDVVELAVGVCHQFVALFCGGIEADGIVHFVVCGVGDFLVRAIHAAAAGIDEMLHSIVSAGFQNVVKADEVAFDVGIGIGDAVTNASLSSQIHYHNGFVLCEKLVHTCLVGDGVFDEGPVATKCFDFF